MYLKFFKLELMKTKCGLRTWSHPFLASGNIANKQWAPFSDDIEISVDHTHQHGLILGPHLD